MIQVSYLKDENDNPSIIYNPNNLNLDTIYLSKKGSYIFSHLKNQSLLGTGNNIVLMVGDRVLKSFNYPNKWEGSTDFLIIKNDSTFLNLEYKEVSWSKKINEDHVTNDLTSFYSSLGTHSGYLKSEELDERLLWYEDYYGFAHGILEQFNYNPYLSSYLKVYSLENFKADQALSLSKKIKTQVNDSYKKNYAWQDIIYRDSAIDLSANISMVDLVTSYREPGETSLKNLIMNQKKEFRSRMKKQIN